MQSPSHLSQITVVPMVPMEFKLLNILPPDPLIFLICGMSEPRVTSLLIELIDDLGTFIGPIFLGIIFNWGLFSCLAVQVYIYYTSSKNDRISLKFLVSFLFLAAIVQTSFATYYAWQALVVSWSTIALWLGDPSRFLNTLQLSSPGKATLEVLPIINGIISATVQIFFSWRIWFLNQTTVGRIFAVLIGIIAVVQFIVSVTFFNLASGGVVITVGWFTGNFVADILITSSMLYALRMAQRQSLSKGTRTIILRLMVNAIETGAVTVIVAGAGLVLCLFSNYFQVITFILGPLFPNVCLANLNSCTQTRRLGDDPQFSTVIQTGERNPGSGHANTTLRFARQSTILARSEVVEP
ncbi:hypothetical protein BD779DRAFT_1804153 [Infundibulicybe gibba]|nr:hypothetical protein BD779DRAFT_1804153 [Infundibulicybe gibba]